MTDDAQPTILHVDLDAFYASVEQLDDPGLTARPVIVGGLGPRGVVAAASYEARRFGVQSAMPMGRARRACPDGVFLAPRFERYESASREVMEILRSFTPLVEPLSLDEAFLDVAGARRLHGPAPAIAESIRASVHTNTGLTASVGVATTKFLAKIASDVSKPDGLLVVEPGTELEFLHPLPVERLWGVGPATSKKLARFGVRTIGDLAALPEDTITGAVGVAHGHHLHALAWNHDERDVEPEQRTKSIGHEETFPKDVLDRAVLEREVLRFADRVASRLRGAGLVGRTVQLKIRYSDFQTITRSRTLAEPTDLAGDLARTGAALLTAVDLGSGVRLLGLSVQQLDTAGAIQEALLLGDDASPTESAAAHRQRSDFERSVDRVRARYGDDAVAPARLMPDREKRGS
ncbi:MAG: DNA polymerase IV [Acidimicrobiia bacterium]